MVWPVSYTHLDVYKRQVLNENGAKLTVDNSTFKDNAADSYGGAVFNNGELVGSDSVFDSNDIVNRGSAGVDYGGAAIYNLSLIHI